MIANARQSVRKEIARTAMAKDVFGRYKQEDKREVRETLKEENEVMRQLKTAFREYSSFTVEMYYKKKRNEMDDDNFVNRAYEFAITKIKDLKYSAKDVEQFSLFISEASLENAFAPIFLSALINEGNENDYTVYTAHWGFCAEALCYRNVKNVTINGDAGVFAGWQCITGRILIHGNADSFVGDEMTGGEIIIKGNAKGSVGSDMKSGNITVEGNAEFFVGEGMKKGKIVVKGNGGDWVGENMKGGEIHLEGDFKEIGKAISGGKIFHKGVLIYQTFHSKESGVNE